MAAQQTNASGLCRTGEGLLGCRGGVGPLSPAAAGLADFFVRQRRGALAVAAAGHLSVLAQMGETA